MNIIVTSLFKIGVAVSILLLLHPSTAIAQAPHANASSAVPVVKKNWYENFSIRGYSQIRYNGAYESNGAYKCDQCDKSWGGNGGFFIRRSRLIFFGNVSPNVYIYIQPDFASEVKGYSSGVQGSSSSTTQFAQIRDAYVDVAFDKKKEYRVRIGQSKVPFGFENMQSSQNRLPIDRADPTNSAVSNERDLGIFFYYAPEKTRELFAKLVSENYKGSGDYGVVGLGFYNGQTANRFEQNKNRHMVARVAYPFELGTQIFEAGVQGYSGRFVVAPDFRRTTTKTAASNWEFADKRFAGTLIMYPRPFGVFAEWNVGSGPEFQVSGDSIATKRLSGGYVTTTMRIKAGKHMLIFPYARGQYYQGGKKHETNATSILMRELEIGAEWQVNKNFEVTPAFIIGGRNTVNTFGAAGFQAGQVVRIQAQFNF
jgi:hypothetical protein